MVLKHPSKDTKDLVCEFCGFSTPSQRKLRAHIHDKHEVEKHKQCTLCDYRCPSRSGLCVSNFLSILSDFLSREKQMQKAAEQFLNDKIYQSNNFAK